MKSTFTDAYALMLEGLLKLRKDKAVTQVVLAKRLGKTQSFVSTVESGVRRLDVVEYYAFVRALGGDPETEFGAVVQRFPKRVRI